MTGDDDRRATRAVYEATAGAYAAAIGTTLNPDFEGPADRAQLDAFAELVRGATRPVADLGCGPGRVARFLADQHVATVGLDLSESMVRIARAAHPDLAFGAGELACLPLGDRSLAGAVCWYSIIHTPVAGLASVFVEVRRTLAAGAPLLVAFQAGDGERLDRDDAHGSGRTLTNHRHHVDTVADVLDAAGFDRRRTTVRPPMSSGEPTPQAFLLATAR